MNNTFKTMSTQEQRLGKNSEITLPMEENARLARENEQLRRIFDIATDQFNSLNKQIEQIRKELNVERSYRQELEKQNQRLQKELSNEHAKANKFANMLFGLKSERLKLSNIKIVDSNTIALNESAKTEIDSSGEEKTAEKNDPEKKKTGGQPGHKGNGRKIPEGLPVVDKVITLPEGEIIHGIPAKDWVEQSGMDEVSYIIRKKVTWYIERIIRRTYKPPADCRNDVPKIITASMPDKLISQGKYGQEVWIDILIDKYQQHIPVQRQIFVAWQHGVNLLPGTVFGGLKTIYETHLKPLYEQLIVELQKGKRWHADETKWYMLCDAAKKLWYMWGFKSEKVTAFVLDATRSASVPAKTLLGIDDLAGIKEPVEIPEERMKICNVDRYSAYKALANLGLLILAFCWAHARRDFTDIVKKYPKNIKPVKWAEKWLVKIAELYRINNKRVKHSQGSELFIEYDTKLRQALDRMKKEIDAELEIDENHVHEARFKTMKSMKNHWDGLTVFLDHPEIPMDNNRMENGIRPCALGRNNYIGNHSEWGGELSACMYSIIQTCIQNRINPKAYLKYYFEKSIGAKGKMRVEKINSMLPCNLKDNDIAKYDLSLKKF
jgi:transposase